MWSEFITALALLLIIEGILPAIYPGGLRRAMLEAARLSDDTLRSVGLAAILVGLVILTLTR